MALLENKRAILGIKGYFWEGDGYTDLRTRALATSLPPFFGYLKPKKKLQKFF